MTKTSVSAFTSFNTTTLCFIDNPLVYSMARKKSPGSGTLPQVSQTVNKASHSTSKPPAAGRSNRTSSRSGNNAAIESEEVAAVLPSQSCLPPTKTNTASRKGNKNPTGGDTGDGNVTGAEDGEEAVPPSSKSRKKTKTKKGKNKKSGENDTSDENVAGSGDDEEAVVPPSKSMMKTKAKSGKNKTAKENAAADQHAASLLKDLRMQPQRSATGAEGKEANIRRPPPLPPVLLSRRDMPMVPSDEEIDHPQRHLLENRVYGGIR
ncbi:hypothetical protein FRC02_004896 [Tulasnella sp. 418]|nr:hypothetical protein FRC02_004896 [Tulasnella sp. 418]